MEDMLNKDIIKGGVDVIDLVSGSIAKPIVEKAMSPVVGNGNILSGAVKLGVAFGVAKYGGRNRLGKAVAIGAGMDGAEDMVVGISSKMGMKRTASTSSGFKF